ncbi:hypothetical protein H4219_005142 [Mycoemilia scoparia]|uniref:Dienelactone hydrolase domain-containing protein n=1 Tax=Mycoemilia scoparia TaxID=417184 RepID=A0A9W7ZUU2_9FUNG|nr:hypothetical protein H4219_005142 [Mycoemilia scoparia]
MSGLDACCSTPPVVANYKAKGETIKIGDRDCYVVGDKSSKRAIIYIYDIFGYHPNAYQGADILSSKGFRVFIPDFFNGNPLVPSDLGNKTRLMNLIKERVDWNDVVLPNLNKVREYLQEKENITKVGVLGFCWGAKMATLALNDETKFYQSAALIHPSFPSIEDFENAQGPICLLPSKDEGPMKDMYQKLESKEFYDKCFYHYFDDMPHGFCAARGDWENSDIERLRACEALGFCAEFFNKTVTV